MPPALALAFGPRREGPAALALAVGFAGQALTQWPGEPVRPLLLLAPYIIIIIIIIMGQWTDAIDLQVRPPILLLLLLVLVWDNGLTPSIDPLIELDLQVRTLYYYIIIIGQWTDASDRSMDD